MNSAATQLSPAARSALRLLVMLQASIALHIALILLPQFGAIERGAPPPRELQVTLAPMPEAHSLQPVLLKAIDRPVKTQARDWVPPAPDTPPSPPPGQSPPSDEPHKPGMPAEAAGATTLDIPLAADDTYYPLKELDEFPKLVRGGKPVYPRQAEDANLKGEVTVLFLLNEKGEVEDVSIVDVKPAGYGFEEAVMQWLAQARFKPAIRKGRVVKGRVVYRVQFDPQ